MEDKFEQIREKGLYHREFEHDNCGIGAIIDVEGRASHKLDRKSVV